MLCSLIAYDANGDVVATLDHVVAKDSEGRVVGLVDFEAQELSGGELTDIWQVSGATGSKTWPEWIGPRIYDFRVELVGLPGRKRITSLVHKVSGFRRERAAIEAEIARRIAEADGKPADIRDLVGGPERPLVLAADGRNLAPVVFVPSSLPVVPLGD